MRRTLGIAIIVLVLVAGCAASTSSGPFAATPSAATPSASTGPGPTSPPPASASSSPAASSSPEVICGDIDPSLCPPVVDAALAAVSSATRTPVRVWVQSGFFCPRADCVFDPNQNFPMPVPPAGGTWVASVEVGFAGMPQHAGLHVAKVGSKMVAVVIGFRVPLPGWCSGPCGSPAS